MPYMYVATYMSNMTKMYIVASLPTTPKQPPHGNYTCDISEKLSKLVGNSATVHSENDLYSYN